MFFLFFVLNYVEKDKPQKMNLHINVDLVFELSRHIIHSWHMWNILDVFFLHETAEVWVWSQAFKFNPCSLSSNGFPGSRWGPHRGHGGVIAGVKGQVRRSEACCACYDMKLIVRVSMFLSVAFICSSFSLDVFVDMRSRPQCLCQWTWRRAVDLTAVVKVRSLSYTQYRDSREFDWTWPVASVPWCSLFWWSESFE